MSHWRWLETGRPVVRQPHMGWESTGLPPAGWCLHPGKEIRSARGRAEVQAAAAHMSHSEMAVAMAPEPAHALVQIPEVALVPSVAEVTQLLELPGLQLARAVLASIARVTCARDLQVQGEQLANECLTWRKS